MVGLANFHQYTKNTKKQLLLQNLIIKLLLDIGTVVMTDGEELDSWSVIINGNVEVLLDGGGGMTEPEGSQSSQTTAELHLGDSFGITPTMDKLYHRGVMRTKCDDCQFVCVTQTDYYRILHQVWTLTSNFIQSAFYFCYK